MPKAVEHIETWQRYFINLHLRRWSGLQHFNPTLSAETKLNPLTQNYRHNRPHLLYAIALLQTRYSLFNSVKYFSKHSLLRTVILRA